MKGQGSFLGLTGKLNKLNVSLTGDNVNLETWADYLFLTNSKINNPGWFNSIGLAGMEIKNTSVTSKGKYTDIVVSAADGNNVTVKASGQDSTIGIKGTFNKLTASNTGAIVDSTGNKAIDINDVNLTNSKISTSKAKAKINIEYAYFKKSNVSTKGAGAVINGQYLDIVDSIFSTAGTNSETDIILKNVDILGASTIKTTGIDAYVTIDSAYIDGGAKKKVTLSTSGKDSLIQLKNSEIYNTKVNASGKNAYIGIDAYTAGHTDWSTVKMTPQPPL